MVETNAVNGDPGAHESGVRPIRAEDDRKAELRAGAMRWAKCGVPVLPLARGSKKPVWREFFAKATTNADRIGRMLDGNAGWIVGLLMGTEVRQGRYLMALDVDPRDNGRESVERLQRELGFRFPVTAKQFSGREDGGYHLLMTTPRPAGSRPLKQFGYRGVDIKGWHSYVVGAPSPHPSTGQPYRVEVWPDEAIADCPTALLKLLKLESPLEIGEEWAVQEIHEFEEAQRRRAMEIARHLCEQRGLPSGHHSGRGGPIGRRDRLSSRRVGTGVGAADVIADQAVARWPVDGPGQRHQAIRDVIAWCIWTLALDDETTIDVCQRWHESYAEAVSTPLPEHLAECSRIIKSTRGSSPPLGRPGGLPVRCRTTIPRRPVRSRCHRSSPIDSGTPSNGPLPPGRRFSPHPLHLTYRNIPPPAARRPPPASIDSMDTLKGMVRLGAAGVRRRRWRGADDTDLAFLAALWAMLAMRRRDGLLAPDGRMALTNAEITKVIRGMATRGTVAERFAAWAPTQTQRCRRRFFDTADRPAAAPLFRTVIKGGRPEAGRAGIPTEVIPSEAFLDTL